MLSSWNYFVIFIFVIVSPIAADEYCYSLDNNPYGYFGTKTPYSNVRSAQIAPPTDCRVVYVWGLIRHGTRHANKDKELTSETLTPIRDEIIANHRQHNRGQLCNDDLTDLQNWNFPWEDGLCGKIMPQGLRDMENIAVNMKRQLPDFFRSASKDKFIIQSSTKSRCQESAIAFTNELYGSTATEVDENNIQINNNMLRTQGRKKAAEVEELNKFKNSILMDNVLSQISSRLGYTAKLNFEFVYKLYDQCVFEKAMNIRSKSPFCAAFTPDHMKIMEYCEDLDTYYTLGHGESKFKEQACPLVVDLYKKLENVQTKQNPSVSGNFYFANAQILLPVLTKMGLFRDAQPLTSDDYATRGESRAWKTSLMSPFAGNIMAVASECTNGMSVSFYVNEALLTFPSCPDGRCLWQSFKDGTFKNEIMKDCNAVTESDTAKDVKAKEEEKSSNCANQKDKCNPSRTEKDPCKDVKEDSKETLMDEIKKTLKEIISKMENQAADSGKSVKKEPDSSKDSSKGSGAAGLQSMEFQTIFLVALFTIVGLFRKFI